jgi:hypothetical protein
MLELRGEVDLAAESLDADLGGQLGRQHLDDHFTAETPFFGHEHARHTAAELVLERVVTAKGRLESLAKVGVHGSWSAVEQKLRSRHAASQPTARQASCGVSADTASAQPRGSTKAGCHAVPCGRRAFWPAQSCSRRS